MFEQMLSNQYVMDVFLLLSLTHTHNHEITCKPPFCPERSHFTLASHCACECVFTRKYDSLRFFSMQIRFSMENTLHYALMSDENVRFSYN